MRLSAESADQPRWTRAAIGFVIAVGLVIQSRALGIFFHHDDLGMIEHLAAGDAWREVLAVHVDHLPLTQNALYLVFLRLFGATALPWHILLLAILGANAFLLDALLRRLGASALARVVSAATFTATAVFHEAVYWVSAANFALALFFSLVALVCLCRGDETSGRAWRGAALLASLLAILSSSIAGVLPVLGLLVAWALPGRRRRGRYLTFAGVPAVAVVLFAPVSMLVRAGAVTAIGERAASWFDPVGGIVIAVSGMAERLAGSYFTGGRLPAAAAVAVFMVLVVFAWFRPDGIERRPRAASVGAPVAWMLATGFTVYAFRSWLGEVVFVSRYQLFPAVGLAWLTAHAVDGFVTVASRRGARARRASTVVVACALSASLGLSAYAHSVVARRWRDRTEALGQAHRDIRRGLQALAAEARGNGAPITIRDYCVGGGTGYRPRLAAMSVYLLSPAHRAPLRFVDDRAIPLPPSVAPLAASLRAGSGSWIEWLDDLSVMEDAREPATNAMPLMDVFPVAERVEATRHGQSTRLETRGQGYVGVLRTAPRDDIGAWKALRFRVRADGAGEILVAFTGPDVPELGRGARIQLHPGEERRVAIDVPLATRGAARAARQVEIRLVGELTAYEIGDIAIER